MKKKKEETGKRIAMERILMVGVADSAPANLPDNVKKSKSESESKHEM